MRHIPKAYEIYRHFKGGLYQIVAIAKSSEDESQQVVYQALYEPFSVYVRPLEMFMSEVDRDKYPEVTAKYRFEQIEMPESTQAQQVRQESVQSHLSDEETNRSIAPEAESDDPVSGEALPAWESADPEAGEAALDPLLLDFLDADTYARKLEIFRSLRARITQDMITTIAVALDLEVDEGELEERCRQIEHCLATFEKYECNRLR